MDDDFSSGRPCSEGLFQFVVSVCGWINTACDKEVVHGRILLERMQREALSGPQKRIVDGAAYMW